MEDTIMNKKVMAIVAVIALVAILGVCLVACNAESIQKKLEKKDYVVHVASDTELKVMNVGLTALDCEGKIEWMVSGTNGDDYVSVTKFEKSADAKKYRDKNKDNIPDGYKVSLVGTVLYVGTEQGVKDAK